MSYNNKIEFDLEKYMVDEEEPENELLDYTTSFLKTLKKLSGKDGFGAIIWIDGTTGSTTPGVYTPNIFHQRRGDLDTQGWTLTVELDF